MSGSPQGRFQSNWSICVLGQEDMGWDRVKGEQGSQGDQRDRGLPVGPDRTTGNVLQMCVPVHVCVHDCTGACSLIEGDKAQKSGL